MTEKKVRKKQNYIDNAAFYAAMVQYKDLVAKHLAGDGPKPKVPDYVAKCIVDISNKLSEKPCFNAYAFRDEMIGDGIENCLMYINNFDHVKYKNPFAYFTQIIYFAFLRRIQKEKDYLFTKYKLIEHVNVFGESSDTQDHDSETDFNDGIKMNDYSEDRKNEFVEKFEIRRFKKKQKAK